MSLANERITCSPLEESLTNIPLELNGGARGMGIQVAAQGSMWTPSAQETPQLAQSVDTEGALNIATTIGLRQSPVIKFGVVEPLDPAGTNWVLNPQCVSTGSAFTETQASGAFVTALVRDLIGYDYAILQVNPGTTSAEGVSAPMGTAPVASGNVTAGVWLKGAVGGEGVQLSLNGNGVPVTFNVTLTTSWQWVTVTSSWSVTAPSFFVVGQSNVPLSFYATGWNVVPGSGLANGFDGTLPGCAWSAGPHSSQSIRPGPGGARMAAIMGDLEQQVKLMSQYGGTVRRMIARSSGAPLRVTYDVVNAQVSWDDTEYTLAGIAQGTITFECQPYGRGAEMTTVTDSFDPVIAVNYAVDAGALTNFTWSASGLVASLNLSTENRFLNMASEYPLFSGEVQATFTPGATISGWKGGVIAKRQDASNYLEAYVSDAGSSVLNLDTIVAGSRTNQLTAALTRIANGTPYTIRCRTQRQNNVDNVYVEYFANTTSPAVTGTPTATLGPYVIANTRVFGAHTAGLGGIVWTPKTAGATSTNLIISPYLARERTLPVLRFGLAGVPGTVPGLGRMDITDISGNAQLWGVWGQRHDRFGLAATTTDLFYEGEALTPVNGATIVTGVAGASSGTTVQISSLPGGAWVSFLSNEIAAGSAQMTHQGSYNVWARCSSTTGTPQFRLQWGVGSLSVPTTNVATTIPGTTGFFLLNLGVVQLTQPPVGNMEWFGAVQAFSAPGGDNASVDCIFFQPLDDGAATMSYTPIPASSLVSTSLPPTTGIDDSGVGTATWFNPDNVEAPDGAYVSADGTSHTTTSTHYLRAQAFGYVLPSSATISGIQVSILRVAVGSGTPLVTDNRVRLIKAGTIQTTDRASPSLWPTNPQYQTYGGPTDLWGGTWAFSDINAAGFGVAVSATINNSLQGGIITAGVDYAFITVYYTLGSGLLIAQDAVLYPGQTAEIASSYAWRVNAAGAVWGQVGTYQGQYMKVPVPSVVDAFETVLVKASRNTPASADTGLDDIQAQVSITPRYAQIPDQ